MKEWDEPPCFLVPDKEFETGEDTETLEAIPLIELKRSWFKRCGGEKTRAEGKIEFPG